MSKRTVARKAPAKKRAQLGLSLVPPTSGLKDLITRKNAECGLARIKAAVWLTAQLQAGKNLFSPKGELHRLSPEGSLRLDYNDVREWIEGMCTETIVTGIKEIEQALGKLKTPPAPRSKVA